MKSNTFRIILYIDWKS